MFLYAYRDILGLFDRALIESILEGEIPLIGPITQGLKLGIAIWMSIPAMMIFTSVVAPNHIVRWANVGVGVIYTLVTIATVVGSWLYRSYFGLYFELLEVALTGYIAWSAYRWNYRADTPSE